MISALRLAANRANAQKSTGPRTAAGKMRAAQNARRHGLTLPVAADPHWQRQVGLLAQAIAGGSGDPHCNALAMGIATAEIELRRVREARLPLLEAATFEAVRRLATIDRYEGRVRSRRKFALRAFAAAHRALRSGQPAQIGQNEPEPIPSVCQNEPKPSPSSCQNEPKER
jgi:hypothetical protein